MRVGSQNKFCHFLASLVHVGVRNCFYRRCRFYLVGQSHDTVTFGCILFGTFATVTTPVLGVLVNTLQYHDTVDFVQDSETEDPQLVAEQARGSKPWQDNGKELMRRQQRFGQDPPPSFSAPTLAYTYNGNAIFDSSKHRCRRTGREDGS